ncbi:MULTISPECIES: DEAD/DEAH box helicase [unclassified Thiocapsa]|uniref:DEAD/DEAH box helicase n=1 Tax=unclassified Thiocapsa TaxID=2641286 RepID=UPI0035B1AEB7
MNALRDLLSSYREAARTEREKGTYFERLAIAFLTHDPVQVQQYEAVHTYKDWALSQGWDGRDTGIDLVATLRGEEGFAAIQCKFYDSKHRIRKEDIDSFISASGKEPFKRRVIIDTTDVPWSENAETMLRGQALITTRLSLADFEASSIQWELFAAKGEIVLAKKKTLQTHQKDAVAAVRSGLEKADRGKLIMACGTGKTFTSLKIAEDQAGLGGFVLFLVPSLALMSQTVREWTADADTSLRSFAVCSDTQVGKRRVNAEDVAEIDFLDLAFPATTDAAKLAASAKHPAADKMTVIFATYHSIQVISNAQQKHGLPEFDLIICDEAHRTTGATLDGEDDSNFVKVHDQKVIAGKKRLYMTATPKVFGEAVRAKASEVSAVLYDMDNHAYFGDTLFARGFGWAVEHKLLTDYKVLVLAVDEQMVSTGVQKRLADGTSEMKLDDATKIIGCYKALAKHGLKGELLTDPQPMKRALAFCKDIATSQMIQQEFAAVISEYLESEEGKETEGDAHPLECQLEHVDGTFNAKSRDRLLNWLKDEHGENSCRILTNARCLSEGVDVPALEAILFMHPRRSQIDVVQSVGRVMRRAKDKNMGYVILPIGVPAGVAPEDALNDNERYRVVWQILNALRSHDERFDAMINKADLGVDVSDHIEVIAVTNKLPTHKDKKGTSPNIGHGHSPEDDDEGDPGSGKPVAPFQNSFAFDEFSKAIMAKIVKKCGRRDYWEDWAADIAKIAQTHITRITALVEKHDAPERQAFDAFLAEIKDDLNDSINEAEAIEMLAQHIITRPVFEALFEGYSFSSHNPVSRAMQQVLDKLDEHNLEKESESLQKFYESVKRRATNIDNAQAKQKIIVELYDKFFRNAFPKMTERLGIVYTPVEVVDFIIHSVNEVLQREFGQTLGSKGVHILDPFTGTGTFITRLLQSGLIKSDELAHKYQHEIHANEIVLLAYYIAAINIEAAYHGLAGGEYVPFEGICLTDTFQLYEQERDLISDLMADNSTRRSRQKELDIRVIFGNPPYSKGQESANDNAANLSYPRLDGRIEETYAARSTATLKNSLYDSYIRAIRWASDRIGDAGVVAFVSNAGWIDGNAADGLRKCFADEFTSIHVFHLRGNQRTSGERSRREGGKIFGSGSRAPIAITILVKNSKSSDHGRIRFYDIGDYLSREQKLAIVAGFGSISGVECANGWRNIVPDKHGDWLNQRDIRFDDYLVMGDKSKGSGTKIFETYSGGIMTNRDIWVFNASRKALSDNMRQMIHFYNMQVDQFGAAFRMTDRKAREAAVDSFIDADPSKVSWSRALKGDLVKGKKFQYDPDALTISVYRPFTRQWLYYNRNFNEMVLQMPRLFPHKDAANRVIMIKSRWGGDGHLALMMNAIPEQQTDGGSQCFPRYIYDVEAAAMDEKGQSDMLVSSSVPKDVPHRDAITEEGLSHFQTAYPGEKITKDDLFYYVYGVLHSEDYRSRYAENLSKELPRIPAVKSPADFLALVTAGRRLGDLHCGYETVEPYPVIFSRGDTRLFAPDDPVSFYRVEKMKFGGKRPNLDKTTVIYNSNITITGIPLESYEYIVNGKPALEWVMERQCVKTDKNSGIVNDANRYAIETAGDPAYPLKLFQRVITVSLETMEIVKALPLLGDLS